MDENPLQAEYEARYGGMVLHHTLFDWSDKSLTPDSITETLLGFQDHWDDPEFEGMEPLEIEREILLSHGRDNWYQESDYGKPCYQHFLTLIQLLFPMTDVTPSLADSVMLFCKSIGFRKCLNIIGSQNSSKSASVIRIMVTAMYLDADHSVGMVNSPFKIAADATVYGDLEELYDELVVAHPNPNSNKAAPSPLIFPDAKKYQARKIVFKPNVPKGGHIVLKTASSEGQYKGQKTKGKDKSKGLMLVALDEASEFKSLAFAQSIHNLSSQPGFFAFITTNFKDQEDLAGIFCQPSGVFGGPKTYDDLDVDSSLWWISQQGSITLRFDCEIGPNIMAKRVIYEYLIKEKDMARLEESGGGKDSLIYMSQARSFPIKGGANNSVLSRSKISASRHQDPNFQLHGIRGNVAFVDLAFGGRDSAVYASAAFGNATVLDEEGLPQEQDLLIFSDHMTKLKLVNDAFWNDYWRGRCEDIGLSTKNFPNGSEVSVEQQLAIQCRELNRQNNVPPANFGYDFSMRADSVSAMSQIVGHDSVAFQYNQKPHGYYLENTRQQTEEVCKNMLAEMAMMAADIVLTQQLRGGAFIDTALTQLNRTLLSLVNQKYMIENKIDYKARWNGVSPDHRDCYMGIVKMALDRGFRKGKNKSAAGDASVWRALQKSGAGKAKVISRI